MSTYNGEAYLEAQIESILGQSVNEYQLELLVRDDGSSDSTRDILARYAALGLLKWYSGDNLGPRDSFMNLIRTTPSTSLYYALSDQDDVWLPGKLERAIRALTRHADNQPSLYYGRTKLVDNKLQPIGLGPVPAKGHSLKQAVLSTSCTGCTIVFNKCFLDILKQATPPFEIMHDNWIFKLASAFNAHMLPDNKPFILYRQHSANVIGAHSNALSKLLRHFQSIQKNPRYRSRSLRIMYEAYKDLLPEDNRKTLQLISYYRHGLNRFRILADRGFRVHSMKTNLLFVVSILTGTF